MKKGTRIPNTIFVAIVMIAVVVAPHTAIAQNNINSPYTRFGYGQIEDDCFSKSQAMGGTAIGIRDRQTINPINPASYSSVDSTSFIFEMGVSGLVSTFSTANGANTTFTGSLDYIALQSPVTKWMGLSVGLIPYSLVGYDYSFRDSIGIPGSETKNIYNQSYYGTGGLSQIYLGLSFDIAKHLSLGVNGYYMFGNINHQKAITYTTSEITTNTTLRSTGLDISSFNARFGLQYHETVGTKHAFTIGAIYEFKSAMSGKYEQTTEAADTIRTSMKQLFELPSLYGAGFTYTFDKRLTIGADFTFQEYSKALYFGKTDSLNNRMKITLGGEYIHNPRGRRYIDRMYWRLGANYRSSYINTSSGPTNDFSITCGIGLPLRTSQTLINVNFEYGRVGAGRASLLNERYFKFGLNFSLNEIWFVKAKVR